MATMAVDEPDERAVSEYRIDELARTAGTTVRNVRAYQDRDLLPPPRREGRVAWYSDAHVARLRLIAQFLERGYTLANIHELVAAWESGQDMGEWLGLEAALTEPWSDQAPVTMTVEELASVFGTQADDDRDVIAADIDRAIALGILEQRGEEFVVHNPRLLRVGAELVTAGIPLTAVLELGQRLRADIDRVAAAFVELVTTHVFEPVGEPIPAEEVPRLADIVRRLRPLAKDAVDSELADAMERHVAVELQNRLSRMVAEYQQRGEAS